MVPLSHLSFVLCEQVKFRPKNKVKIKASISEVALLSLFPFFHFSFFHFSFKFVLFFKFMSKSRFKDTNIFNERERESPKPRVEGWSSGAMVLGKL